TNNVVFPTGAIVRDKKLYIYYGAADKLIAAKSINLTELLTELKKNSLKL
ncbi:pesticidal protein Cry7Aa, partial [Candidatus Parcubacteria bacterium]|nr:pesticidal protein Cry7Aa [Candidatus Parcubacteria bacterium]